MIHIDLNGHSPDPAWLARADGVTSQILNNGLSDEDRQSLIDRNEHIWRDLMPWLKTLSRDKCWYSEARDCAAYWHVDHFRPKKEIKDLAGTTYEGYWWLAFNWQNYRLAGGAVNTPKSTKFPVRENTTWACGPDDDIEDEHPYLLDPTCPEDPALLSFNEQGKATPADPNDCWHKDRADVSIAILNLNYDSLKRGRKRVWDQCSTQSQDVLQCKATLTDQPSASKKQKLRNGINVLKDMVRREAEFSAVAAICVRAQGDTWLERAVFGN